MGELTEDKGSHSDFTYASFLSTTPVSLLESLLIYTNDKKSRNNRRNALHCWGILLLVILLLSCRSAWCFTNTKNIII